MQGNFSFAIARIRSLESKSLNAEKMSRILDAKTTEDAFKVLQEVGYGGTIATKDYDALIEAEERATHVFLKEVSGDDAFLNSFLQKFDYHNAKVCMKAKYGKVENFESFLYDTGKIDAGVMKDSIFTDHYELFDERMRKCLQRIDMEFATQGQSPRMVDWLLDQAYFGELDDIAHRYRNATVQKYLQAVADFDNILLFLRLKAIHLSTNTILSQRMPGGVLTDSELLAAADGSTEAFLDKIRYTPYIDCIRTVAEYIAKGSLTELEVARDRYLLKILSAEKNDSFSVIPVAYYYLQKTLEANELRMIFTGKVNQIDGEILQRKLRKMYE